MQLKPKVAPLFPPVQLVKSPVKRTLLLIDLPADIRCTRLGNAIESRGPISARLISETLPDTVVISLIANHTDAIENLETLSALGFRGRCLVLANSLPNRSLVLKELRQHAAGLRITLLAA